MGNRLNPYLGFDGNAREAMEFYRDVFGGELQVSTFADMPGLPAPDPDNVLHAQLETPDGFTLMASDPPPGEEYSAGGSMSVSLSGDGADELRGYWAKLADGGQVVVPMEKQAWGDEYGQVIDRFGVRWQVNIGV